MATSLQRARSSTGEKYQMAVQSRQSIYAGVINRLDCTQHSFCGPAHGLIPAATDNTLVLQKVAFPCLQLIVDTYFPSNGKRSEQPTIL